MSHRVRIAGMSIEFACEPDETVLEAAERAGYSLPYSCRKGACSTCEGELVCGDAYQRGRGHARGPADALLFCQARPLSDIEIAPRRIDRRDPAVRKLISATVFRIVRAAPDVSIVQLRFPAGMRARFRAGQYLRVLIGEGDSRNYSMANCPRDNDGAELHIRHVPGGAFSANILERLAKGDRLQVDLPYGQFTVDADSAKPIILLATGTGFAPVKSMVEEQIRLGSSREMHLYWGAQRRDDLYLTALPEKWAAAGLLSYVPVLSSPDADWRGRTGLVHESVLADFPDLSGYEVYACGNPMMIAAARADFAGAGLPADRYHCDAFVPSGNPSTADAPQVAALSSGGRG
ncbi:MAG: 3-phenylpropionate/trans-cinnamate dioxygenase ferredoxin reductase component [Sphingomonadales bacterium]|jgi:CDP-4-dehydro-6-deoxyglucose reductase/3-phenylpropionate/trans-cinnamate dioxygenase ferredoxin reductase subunit|nr:3-phenylpropionate/trans-cinnamate dioxygenase ferredoxin reductase component [Sphingomonadales bacterium]